MAGSNVTVTSWPEMWPNEGFTGYFEWRWTEFGGGPSAQASFDASFGSIPADHPFWRTPVGPSVWLALPGPEFLFDFAGRVSGADEALMASSYRRRLSE